MPYGDEKHNLIYQELVNVLGPDYVSDDPGVLEAYYRCGLSPALACKGRSEFVVLPGSTEDVQKIVRLARRYQFPYSITSTGMRMYSCNAVAGYQYWCFIDPKRMNQWHIDPVNMFAVVQPYVMIGQIQGEAMKYGLHSEIPGSGSQSSVLAHNIAGEVGWTCWRTGSSARNVLGMEWVLPDGEILRTGSLATKEDNYFWGEGPGPDMRGLLRGLLPHFGTLGVVTKIAVKLFPWPSPPVLHTEGVQPEKKASLPANRFKTIFATFPSLEKKVEAIREMGKMEICGWVMSYAPYDVHQWSARSREQYFAEYDFWYQYKFLLCAGIWGYTSEKQLQYEEKVFRDIVNETGGTIVTGEGHRRMDELLTPNTIRDTYRSRFLRSGGVVFGGGDFDSLENILVSIPRNWKILEEFIPPLGDLCRPDKFWPSEFGRYCYPEVDYLRDKSDKYEYEMYEKIKAAQVKAQMDYGVASGKFYLTRMDIIGPAFNNCHILIAKIKEAFDPYNIANPTRVVDISAMKKKGEI
jgi:hypothetical protein